MIDFKRMAIFWGKIFRFWLPFGLVTFMLAGVTEVLTQKENLSSLVRSAGFWVSIGLDMLPLIAVSVIPLWLAARFLRAVYGLDHLKAGIDFILHSKFGSPSFSPWMKIKEGEIAQNEDSVLSQIGGPGSLVIANDSAVVLERGGRFSRIVGKGYPRLESFERIYDIVDLRPKEYEYPVSAMSKEGIPIQWDVKIRYQIADGGVKTTPRDPYPLSEKDVFCAATCKWVREAGWRHGQDMDWEGLVVISRMEGTLRSILAQHRLDRLVGLTQSAQIARESIQEELKRKLCQKVPALGAKILEVKLDNLQVDDRVKQQWIDGWKVKWQRWSEGQVAHGEADRIYLYETAKADAQMRLVTEITRAWQELSDRDATTAPVVLMRLFSVLDRANFAAASHIFFPNQALEALKTILSW